MTNKIGTWSQRGTVIAVSAMVALAGLLFFTSSVNAGVGLGVSPSFPSTVTVGDNNVAVSLAITNNSDNGDGNPLTLNSIKMIPSCGAITGTSCTSLDPGVFSVDASGTGSGACAANTFTIAETNVASGEVTFTPNAAIALTPLQVCTINFTVDVVGAPDVDATGAAGTQTLQLANVTGTDQNQQPGSGFGSDTTTVISGLIVDKTSRTAHQKSWNWTIDKSADQTNLLLAEGESFTVNYTVSVSAVLTETIDESGTITITNPAGNPTANITGVTDTFSVDGSATVTCPGGLAQSLAGGASLVCTYQKSPSAAVDQNNTATVTTSGAVPGGTDTVPVTFAPATLVDECITVDDTYSEGPQDVVVCHDAAPSAKTFNYAVTFGPQGGQGVDVAVACGQNSHPNTASFLAVNDDNDTAETGNDSVTVNANVNCVQGCTLTQGYWKTHNASFKGGAPADDAWMNIGASKESTVFFPAKNTQTWFQVFWTAPKGNAYYNLAHQYMAAKINILNGAGAPANVSSAIASAETLFNTYTPAQVAAFKGNNATRKQFVDLAGILGSFNEGLIGPGHCSEQSPPESNTLTFTASNSSYYNGPTSSDPLYATGPITFTWNTTTGVVTGGLYEEIVPPTTGTHYFNNVVSGTVVGSAVHLNFVRTVPDSNSFSADLVLSGNTVSGTLAGPYYFTATGTVAP